jgi:SAM-dependent methyltransferase
MVVYHNNDFDFESWEAEVQSKLDFQLPQIKSFVASANIFDDNVIQNPNDDWQMFFKTHNKGNFFKPRRYLEIEFAEYLNYQIEVVLEVGCGFGCSFYPLLNKFPFKVIATDYSSEALDILKLNSKYDENRILFDCWDITNQPPEKIKSIKIDVVLCIFVLSAILPQDHICCLKNLADLSFRNDGIILFRDYAVYDMTMYRHKIRLMDKLFCRSDGTYAYYFDLNYIRQLCQDVDLEVLELEYATVINKNRKTNKVMKRVFIHGVFKKIVK